MILLEELVKKLYTLLEQEDEVGEIPKSNDGLTTGLGDKESPQAKQKAFVIDKAVELGKHPISRQKLVSLIKNTRGKMMSIVFRKKDGTVRLINTVTGVRKNITGSGLKYNPDDYGYLILYDLKKRAYRTVNIDTIGDVKMDKKVFTMVKENLKNQRFPLPFKNGGISLEGEPAWKHWKHWTSINRTDNFVLEVLNTIKKQGYTCSLKQFQVLVKWFNNKR